MSTPTVKIAIAGASGYAGGEILRLLLQHPKYHSGELEIGALTGSSTVGQSVAELMPHLPQLANRVLEDTTVENLQGHDVVFLGLPHGHSAAIAKALGEDVIVIDCAADFRLRDAAAWEHYYGTPYAGHWPYGIPELPGQREVLASTNRVAVPGCFPTGATLAAWPAVAAGLITPDLRIVSITGVSGGGKKANVGLLGAETMGSLKAYNTAGRHRHTPEIKQNFHAFSSHDVSVSFTPVLAPLPRGILTTVTAPIVPGVDEQHLRQAYLDAYANEPFMHLLPAGIQPQTQSVVGANSCHIQVEVDQAAQVAVLTSAIDNLTKGTAGAAVQCMNIRLAHRGYEETFGLAAAGVAP